MILVAETFDPVDHITLTITVAFIGTVRIVFDVQCAWQCHSISRPAPTMTYKVIRLNISRTNIRSCEVISASDNSNIIRTDILLRKILILVAGSFRCLYISKSNSTGFDGIPIDITLIDERISTEDNQKDSTYLPVRNVNTFGRIIGGIVTNENRISRQSNGSE